LLITDVDVRRKIKTLGNETVLITGWFYIWFIVQNMIEKPQVVQLLKLYCKTIFNKYDVLYF
jgi:hypothetical protein